MASEDLPAGATPREAERPNVYAFRDYRDFLRAFYVSMKSGPGGFSFRAFNKLAGFRSPNFLKLVMDGDRNLGPAGVKRVARALKLDSHQRRHFGHLVEFCQAPTDARRSDAYRRLQLSERAMGTRRIEADSFDYLSHWYYPAIREMTCRSDFDERPEWVAARLLPPISPEQARGALEALERMGLIVRDASGRLVRGEPGLATDPEVEGLAVRNYHEQMLDRARAAMVDLSAERREIGATTFGVRGNEVDEVKARVREFRRAIAQLYDSQEGADTVYQLNIQLFPLTAAPGEGAA